MTSTRSKQQGDSHRSGSVRSAVLHDGDKVIGQVVPRVLMLVHSLRDLDVGRAGVQGTLCCRPAHQSMAGFGLAFGVWGFWGVGLTVLGFVSLVAPYWRSSGSA